MEVKAVKPPKETFKRLLVVLKKTDDYGGQGRKTSNISKDTIKWLLVVLKKMDGYGGQGREKTFPET